MTQREEQILIAKTAGWTSIYIDPNPVAAVTGIPTTGNKDSRPLPWYHGSVNAVIEACNVILTTQELRACYAETLAWQLSDSYEGKIRVPEPSVGDCIELPAYHTYRIINATAGQRATALVAVIRKHIKPEA